MFVSISALSTLHPNFGSNDYYYEDFPNLKGATPPPFPMVFMDNEVEQESLTIKGKKIFPMTTEVKIYVDHFVEETNPKLTDYMNAIATWFFANKATLRWTYGIWDLRISKERDTEVKKQKEFAVGTLTFDYHVTLNTE